MSLEEKIVSVLRNEKRGFVSFDVLLKKIGLSKEKSEILRNILSEFLQSGKVIEKNKKFALTRNLGLHPAKVVSLHKSFGFAQLENGEEVFIPGREMMGSLPNDLVLVKLRHLKNSREAVVYKIIAESDGIFSGDVVFERGKAYFSCDQKIKILFELLLKKGIRVSDGDKVAVKILRRGSKHFDYKAVVTEVFGSGEIADVCAKAIITQSGAPNKFEESVLNEAKQVSVNEIHPKEILSRLDLRKENIFTIDSADSKDLDDAISIKKTKSGYVLGVHIADVSFFVKHGGELDKEARLRGTSIYYADQVIPMLPKELSNGICSLNEGEDRLTFSVIMNLDKTGKLCDFEIKKSVINSRVKGVYSEINEIIDGSAKKDILLKYKHVSKEIKLMCELADILFKRRTDRGYLDIVSLESKIKLNSERKAVEILPRSSGKSERIIEEFMLLANEAVATFAQNNNLPFIYRIHEYPDAEKVHLTSVVLKELGIDTHSIEKKATNFRMCTILNEVRDTKFHTLVNNLVLRSLAKAKYSERNLGHYGLALENYAHFTSPIRRYPDLVIHRILTSAITGMGEKKLHTRYDNFVKSAAVSSSACEARAVKIERDCEDCYKAEFMSMHIGEIFEGEITSVVSHGIYVTLPSTVEGMVSIDNLENGEYYVKENVKVLNLNTKKSYCIGDKVKVKVISANVSKGNVDFIFV